MCLLGIDVDVEEDGTDEGEEERLPTNVDLMKEAAVAAAATATAGGDLLTFLLVPYLVSGTAILLVLIDFAVVFLTSFVVLLVLLLVSLLNLCNYSVYSS